MAHVNRLGACGIGVEAVAGTAVTPTHWLQLAAAPTINDKMEYANIETARGRVEKSQGQKLMKASGEGNIEVILDQTTSVIPFGLILGSVSSASGTGGKYDHSITVNNSNTAKTATVVLDRVTDTRKFANSVLDSLSLKVSDGFANLTMGWKSKASSSDTASESYTTVTNFSFAELSAQFGVDVAAATAASATTISGGTLDIKREVELVYQSGSTAPTKIVYKTLEISGDYSLLFEATTDRDKYLNNTANAAIFTFTDSNLNYVKITLPNVLLSNWTAENSLDDVVTQTAEFSAHYDTTQQTSITTVIRNTTPSYTNLTVGPSPSPSPSNSASVSPSPSSSPSPSA